MIQAFNNVAVWTEGNEGAPGSLSTLVPKRKTIRVASQYSAVPKRANTKPNSLVSCMSCFLVTSRIVYKQKSGVSEMLYRSLKLSISSFNIAGSISASSRITS